MLRRVARGVRLSSRLFSSAPVPVYWQPHQETASGLRLAEAIAPSVPFLAAAAAGSSSSVPASPHAPLPTKRVSHRLGGLGRALSYVTWPLGSGSAPEATQAADPDADLSFDGLLAAGKARVDAAFATLVELGVPHYSASDTDLLPHGLGHLPHDQQYRLADAVLSHLEAMQASTGITPLSIHAVLDTGDPASCGAVTSPFLGGLAAAAADVVAAADVAHRLGARYLLLPAGGEGYDCFAATHARRELDHLGQFCKALAAHTAGWARFTPVLVPGSDSGGGCVAAPWVPDAAAAAWLLARYGLPSGLSGPAEAVSAGTGGQQPWRVAGVTAAGSAGHYGTSVEAQSFFLASFGALGPVLLPPLEGEGGNAQPFYPHTRGALDPRRALLLQLVALMQSNRPGFVLQAPVAGAAGWGPHEGDAHHGPHNGSSHHPHPQHHHPHSHPPHYYQTYGSNGQHSPPAHAASPLAPWLRALDALAQAYLAAERIVADNGLAGLIMRRYSTFDSGAGAAYEAGTLSLLDLARLAAHPAEGAGNGSFLPAASPFAPPLLLRDEEAPRASCHPNTALAPSPPPPSLADFEALVDAHLYAPPPPPLPPLQPLQPPRGVAEIVADSGVRDVEDVEQPQQQTVVQKQAVPAHSPPGGDTALGLP